MSATINMLREEHRKLADLLVLLSREIQAFGKKKPVDFELVNSILEYNLNFPDACHHPKEDVVFQHLSERDPEAAKAVGDLALEHEELHALTTRFATAVENILRDHELPRDWFCEIAEEYMRFMRRHMQMEEVVFFPAAERILTEDDWKAVDAQVFRKVDPLFDDHADDRYESLRLAILLSEGEADAAAQ